MSINADDLLLVHRAGQDYKAPAGDLAIYANPGPKGEAGPAGAKGDPGVKGDPGDSVKGEPGEKGADGTSVSLQGSVDDLAELGGISNPQPGDLWVVVDDGTGTPNNAYVYNGDSNDWVLVGPIQGPAGPKGDDGVKGEAGPEGPVTSLGGLTNVDTGVDSAVKGQVLSYGDSGWVATDGAPVVVTTADVLLTNPTTFGDSSGLSTQEDADNYFENELQERVEKAGDTMTGHLSTPGVIITADKGKAGRTILYFDDADTGDHELEGMKGEIKYDGETLLTEANAGDFMPYDISTLDPLP